MYRQEIFARRVSSLLRRVGAALVFANLIPAPAWALQTSTALPGDEAYPESITAMRDGTMYVGSAAAGGVFRVRPHARRAEVWFQPGAFGGPNSIAGSALKGFDLKSGEGGVSALLPSDHTLCNDIAVGPDGSAYVTTLIDQTLNDAFGQRQVTQYFTQLNSYHVILEITPALRSDPQTLSKLYTKSRASGQMVPLSTFVKFDTEHVTFLSINHQGQFPSVTLSFNLAPGAALGDAVKAIEFAASQIRMPASITGSFHVGAY
jgi:AcrB/AcrD/AcrF family